MSDGNALVLGQVVLALYAVILAGGGLMGYLKAGSRPSLIAGTIGGAVALVALGVSFASPRPGLIVGTVLAGLMLAAFLARVRKTRKFMPSGMLAVLSTAVLALLAWVVFQVS